MANSVDPDQTAPIGAVLGAVCSGSTLFASILNSSVMQGNYLQQETSTDDIFRCIVFLCALRVKKNSAYFKGKKSYIGLIYAIWHRKYKNFLISSYGRIQL